MLYKVTDRNGCSRGGTQWGPGITHAATGSPNQDLNSDGWLHAYEHPALALIFKSLHADTARGSKLWEAEGAVGRRCGQVKCACRTLTTIREIPFPLIPLDELADFAQRAAAAAYRGTILSSAMAERAAWAARLAKQFSDLGQDDKALLHAARAAECATLSTPDYRLDLISLLEPDACRR